MSEPKSENVFGIGAITLGSSLANDIIGRLADREAAPPRGNGESHVA